MRLKYEDLKRGMKVKVKSYSRRPTGWHWAMMDYRGRVVTISNKRNGRIQISENVDWRTYGQKWDFYPTNFEVANVWQGDIRDETI